MQDLESAGNYETYAGSAPVMDTTDCEHRTENRLVSRSAEISCSTTHRTAGKLPQINSADVITISDIHGIPARLLLALEQTGCIKYAQDRSWSVHERFQSPTSKIVILGDMLGWDTIGVLNILKELQEQHANTVVIAGNWEASAIAAADGNQDRQREYGASPSGAQVLRSLEGIQESEGYRNPFDALRFVLRERYASVLGQEALRIAFEQDGKLATHAGMDDVWTEEHDKTGTDGMNALFQNLRSENNIREIADRKHGRLSGIVWMSPSDERNNVLMTDARSTTLRKNGIEMIVRGHDHNGLSITKTHGMEILNIAAETPNAYQSMPEGREIQWTAAMTRMNMRGIDLWRNHV